MYNPSHVLTYESLKLDEILHYEEKPLSKLDKRDKNLRNKSIPLVKVLWSNHGTEEVTWEKEADMRQRTPQNFEGNS